jgi:hypothetical protein
MSSKDPPNITHQHSYNIITGVLTVVQLSGCRSLHATRNLQFTTKRTTRYIVAYSLQELRK